MEELSMCRICLTQDVRMHYLVNTSLQETYETLTAMPFVGKGGRPLQICFICYARLRNCYQLRIKCLQSEELISQMVVNSYFKPTQSYEMNMLQTVHLPNIHLNIQSVVTHDSDVDVNIDEDLKKDPLEINVNIHKADEHIEGAGDTLDSTEGHVGDDDVLNYINQAIKAEDSLPLRHFEITIIDDITPEYNIQSRGSQYNQILRTDDSIAQKSDIMPQPNMSSMELKDIGSKNIKVVLHRLESDEIKTNPDVPTIRTDLERSPESINSNNFGRNVMFETNKIIDNEKGTLQETTDSKVLKHKSSEDCTTPDLFCVTNISVGPDKRAIREQPTKHITERPFKCNTCEKPFASRSTLYKHKRIHSGKKPYKCGTCDKCFNIKSNLLTHIRIHTGEKPYKCGICEKCFIYKHHLTSHILIHSGEKPYKCDVCEKHFRFRSGLSRHSRIHTGVKPNKCNTCGKCFIDKSTLSKHIRIHTGEKPYKCDTCEKCFNSKSDLSQHIRIHTGEKAYQCETCEKYFRYRSNLLTHIRIHW